MNFVDRFVARALPIVPRSLVRRFAAPYVAGDQEDQALAAVKQLNEKGMTATLDVLGEDIALPEEAARSAEAYRHLLDSIASHGLDTNVSLKLTALGLKLDRSTCVTNLKSVLAQAKKHDNFVRIDMEDSSCTDTTLDIFHEVRGQYPAVGVVLQACLKRTIDDARALTAIGAPVRLCKGIYIEPAAIAHTDPERVREAYLLALEVLLDGGSRVGIATHDEVLVEASCAMLAERGLAFNPDRYEFQMLLGVLPRLRDSVVARGHRLRVYVPFGEQWYAYSVRRLRENPAIAGHVLRGLVRGDGR